MNHLLARCTNATCNQDCASLRYAALNGHHEAVLLLLDDGRVDVNAHDGFALKWAVRYGHVKIVQALRIRHDGDIEMVFSSAFVQNDVLGRSNPGPMLLRHAARNLH
jgi:ankyrin repeat protein